MSLFLIRHPRTLVAKGICYGRSDVSVSADEQMRVLADVTTRLPRGLPIITSPSIRCTGLADALCEILECGPATRDARLAEMNFGEWEMQNWDAIPREEIDAWTNDLIGFRPGGGETVLEVATRVQSFHNSVRGQDTIVICHAGSIRIMLACKKNISLEAIALDAASTPHEIGYGEIVILHD